MTAFKICGVTRPGDAESAVAAGAAAIGVIFAASPRQVDVPAAQRVTRELPPNVARIGVFAGQPLPFLEEAVAGCGLGWVQLSGDEPASYAAEVAQRCGVRVLKAVHLTARRDLDIHARYPADAWLLDAPVIDGRRGGTGRRFDWSLLEGRRLGRPIVVAGGLHAGNVAEAVTRLRPAGVDVCSGVEASPGIKDPERIRAFAAAVREAMERGGEAGNGGGVFA